MATISDFCYLAPTPWRHRPRVTSPTAARSQWDQLRPYRYVSMCTNRASLGARQEYNSWFTRNISIYTLFFPSQLHFYLKTAPKQNLKAKPHNGKKNHSSPKAPLKLGPRWNKDNITQTYAHTYWKSHTKHTHAHIHIMKMIRDHYICMSF